MGGIQSYAPIPSTGLQVDSIPSGLRDAMVVPYVAQRVGNSKSLTESYLELYQLLARVSRNRAVMLRAEVIPARMKRNRMDRAGCDKAWSDAANLGIDPPMVSAAHKANVC
jgi:hypothetical protein